MKKRFWTSDKLFAILAVVISLTTLIIFVRQTNIIDKQSRLSAMPYLAIETSNNGLEKTFTIDLVNYGVGPAIIESLQIRYKGEKHAMDFITFAEAYLLEMDSIAIISTSDIDPGLAIPVGGTRTMAQVGGNEEDYNNFLVLMENLLDIVTLIIP